MGLFLEHSHIDSWKFHPNFNGFSERIWEVVPSPPMKRHGAVELKEESYEGQKLWKKGFRMGSGG